MKARLIAIAAVALLWPVSVGATDAGKPTNHFASVYIDGDKVGQVHVTMIPDPSGEIVNIKTHASMSVLGIEVYHFNQQLNETWKGSELQALTATTDDDGTKYDVSLARTANGYEGTVNGDEVDLPADSYPGSFWQYAITKATAIFDLKDLALWQVDVSKSDQALDIDGTSIPTERFLFTGEWKGDLWFDEDHKIVQFSNKIRGHDVEVVMDR